MDGNVAEISNITAAKADFLKIFEQLGYSSLEGYYKAVAVDLLKTNTQDEFDKAKGNSSYYCRGCSNSHDASKWYFDGKICYRFDLVPQDGSGHNPLEEERAIQLSEWAT